MKSLQNTQTVRSDIIPVAGLMLLALLYSAYYYSGYYASDDMSYLSAARALADNRPLGFGLGSVRFGITVPAAIAYRLSGGSVFWTVFSFVIYHPLLVLLAFLTGRLAHDRATGLLAGFLVACCPLCYFFSGAMLPDCPVACWTAIGGLIVLYALKKRAALEENRVIPAALFLLAGAAVGLAYTVKENGLIMVVPALLAILLFSQRLVSRQTALGVVAFGLGLTAVIAAETLLIHRLTGGWHLRLEILQGAGAVEALSMRLSQQGVLPWERTAYLFRRLRPLLGHEQYIVLAAVAVYPFLQHKSRYHRRAGMVLLAFFFWPALYQTFGSTNFSMYLPPSIKNRYYIICVLPAAVMAAYVCTFTAAYARRLHWPRPARLAAALLLTVVLPSALAAERTFATAGSPQAGFIYRSRETKAFRTALQTAREQYPGYPVVLSAYVSRRMLPLFNSKPTGVFFTHAVKYALQSSGAPALPFIFISTANLNYNDHTREELAQLQKTGSIRMQPAEPGMCCSPRSRRDEIMLACYRLFKKPEPFKPEYYTETGRAMRLQLVTAAESKEDR